MDTTTSGEITSDLLRQIQILKMHQNELGQNELSDHVQPTITYQRKQNGIIFTLTGLMQIQ